MKLEKPIESLVSPLLRDPNSDEPLHLVEGAFVCSTARYPIVDGIPRFVARDFYARSFSFEWNVHSDTQLDAFRGDQSSEEQFVKKTGFSAYQLRGKLVLDAGVGAGRYTDVVSRWGAHVVAVDLSFAVEAAYRNFRDRPNVFIAQADIGALPFAQESFDYIFCIGVLHHTPDTKRYFLKLVPLLKRGGTIAIWVYPNDGDYVVRKEWVQFVNKIPPRMFYTWCRWFVPWAQARLSNRWVGALRRVFPFTNDSLGVENDILDTFDGFSPRYHHLHNPEEVERWFYEAGLVDVCSPSDWHTCMRGTKPRE
jgi:SAM-dependent methyltransferase